MPTINCCPIAKYTESISRGIRNTISISCLKKLSNLEDAFLDNILIKYRVVTLVDHVYMPIRRSVDVLPIIHLQDRAITKFIEPNKLWTRTNHEL